MVWPSPDTTVYNEPINVFAAKNDNWTLSLDYARNTSFGAFEVTGAETIEEHNQQEATPGAPFLEYVGFPNSGGVAKTKATGTLRWSLRSWAASWTVVYFDGYKQEGAPGDPLNANFGMPGGFTTYTLPQGGYTIPSQIYSNFYVSYAFRKDLLDRGSRWGRWTDSLLDGVKISLNVNNVFNTLPPFDAFYNPLYTSPYGDVQLRNYSVSIKKSF